MNSRAICCILAIISVLFFTGCLGPGTLRGGTDFSVLPGEGCTTFVIRTRASAVELIISKKLDEAAISVPSDALKIVKHFGDKTLVAVAGKGEFASGTALIRVEGERLGYTDVESFKVWLTDRSYHTSEESDPQLLGDFTGDGRVEGFDFIQFAQSYGNAVGAPDYDPIYDLSSLGVPASQAYGGVWDSVFSVAGEADGEINGPDFIVFANNYSFANPYLGIWNFHGKLDYESSTYGKVKADGLGTLVIDQTNWQLAGPVEITATSTYTEEGEVKRSEFTMALDSVNVEFSATQMIVTGNISNPIGDSSVYAVRLVGKLDNIAGVINNEVSGEGEKYGIFLLNPTRKIGEWTAWK